MRRALTALLLLPLFALATPSTLELEWQPVTDYTDGSPLTPVGYEAACGVSPDNLTPLDVVGTSATGSLELPTPTGTVTCAVTTLGPNGERSAATIVEEPWNIKADPSSPIEVIIRLTIQCPEGFSCSASSP